ncbi:hypothetical protein A6F49_03880 [Enteractinococcus helveticum]|uniref:Pyridoxamine 5'-phosphate oxidase N-terminal domain-containing protein n=2 Tax=Enteractinococcus helveticum TaxID=1837282 RepID=A0A1B7M2Z8_9MICC|nr:hypothetical protein A6F49_03880 [Enteractinococcus helveticum]
MHRACEGAWLEAIGIFQQVRSGDHQRAMKLLVTSADPPAVMQNLLRLLVVFLRGEDSRKLERFLDASFRAGPPTQGPSFTQGPTVDYDQLNAKLQGVIDLSAPMQQMLSTHLPLLTTVTPHGRADISPRPSLRVLDDHTLIYHEQLRSQHLVNIHNGSQAVVSVINPETATGYSFVGTPEVHQHGDVLDAAVAFAAKHGLLRPSATLLVPITAVHDIISGAPIP